MIIQGHQELEKSPKIHVQICVIQISEWGPLALIPFSIYPISRYPSRVGVPRPNNKDEDGWSALGTKDMKEGERFRQVAIPGVHFSFEYSIRVVRAKVTGYANSFNVLVNLLNVLQFTNIFISYSK